MCFAKFKELNDADRDHRVIALVVRVYITIEDATCVFNSSPQIVNCPGHRGTGRLPSNRMNMDKSLGTLEFSRPLTVLQPVIEMSRARGNMSSSSDHRSGQIFTSSALESSIAR